MPLEATYDINDYEDKDEDEDEYDDIEETLWRWTQCRRPQKWRIFNKIL